MDERKQRREAFFEMFRKQHPKPYFNFTNIKPSKYLEYEVLNQSNYIEIYKMFKGDTNPYIMKEYQNLERLEEYTDYQVNYNRYSPKRGGCDWLFKLKESKEYIGLLNLYDMSLENFADNDKRCTIGFSTKKAYRRKGFTREAVTNLIHHIYQNFPEREKILAYTKKENEASKRFLEKLGFKTSKEDYISERYDYFELLKQPR